MNENVDPNRSGLDLRRRRYRVCPRCESWQFKKARHDKNENVIVYDRVCLCCDTRYAPVPSDCTQIVTFQPGITL